MDLMSKLKKLPPWSWAVIGVGVVGAVVMVSRKSSPGALIAAPAQAQPAGPAPSGGGGGGSPSQKPVDLSPILGAIGQIGQRQAWQQQQLNQLAAGYAARLLAPVPGGGMTTGGRTAPVGGSAAERMGSDPTSGAMRAHAGARSMNDWERELGTAGMFVGADMITSPVAPIEPLPPGGFKSTPVPTGPVQPVVTEDETMQRLRRAAAGDKSAFADLPPVDLVYDEKKNGPGYKGPI